MFGIERILVVILISLLIVVHNDPKINEENSQVLITSLSNKSGKEHEPLSILSLPDVILTLVFAHLNQIEVLHVMTTHSRFLELGKEKLFKCIYVNQGEPLKVSGDIHTSFHTNFTIINKARTFNKLYEEMKLSLVKKIVSFKNITNHYTWYRELLFVYPQITIIIENPDDNNNTISHLQSEQVSKLRVFTFDYSTVFQECNDQYLARVRELNVIRNSACKQNLEQILRMQNLKQLRLHEVLDIVRRVMRLKGFKTLPIEHFHIIFSQPLRQYYVRDLGTMFDLGKLTSLDLHFCSERPLQYTCESDLKKLLSQATKLAHLSLTYQKIDFIKLIGALKANSLQSLYLRIVPGNFEPVHTQFPMEKILKSQRQSIERAHFSSSRFHYSCFTGLQQFDRIYKNGDMARDPEYRKAGSQGVIAIRKLLRTGYPKLSQILLNERCYFIKSYSDERSEEITCIN